MADSVIELLNALHAAVEGGADTTVLVDEIEAVLADDPEGGRAAVHAYGGDDGQRLWALGLIGDSRDFDVLAAGLADRRLRYTALEALANQPDTDRVEAMARSLLGDPDPRVRSQAAAIVAFHARPGAVASLLPLVADPDREVRMLLGWRLGGLDDPAATVALQTLLADEDEQVRRFAARGLARITRTGLRNRGE